MLIEERYEAYGNYAPGDGISTKRILIDWLAGQSIFVRTKMEKWKS
jgi:hypothetical protein